MIHNDVDVGVTRTVHAFHVNLAAGLQVVVGQRHRVRQVFPACANVNKDPVPLHGRDELDPHIVRGCMHAFVVRADLLDEDVDLA